MSDRIDGRLTDDELRAAWRSDADGGRTPADPAACPGPERIWAAVHGELGPAETRRVVDHLVGCAECAEAWRLARHIGQGAAVPAAARRARAAGSSPRRPWWLAAVAAVLVAAIGIGTRDLWLPGGETFRGNGSAAIRPLVADGAELPRDRFELAWEAVPGAVEYDLRLTTAELAPVVNRQGLDLPRYRVPAERLDALGDGSRLYWQVEAVLEDGERAVSPSWAVVLGSPAGGGGDGRSGTASGRSPP
jgi:hypothetical protein